MTISDSCNKLFLWFKENDYYNEKEDFLKLIKISSEEEKDEASINLALFKLKELKLVEKYDLPPDYEKRIWVLSKKLESYEQNVVISADLAFAISSLINSYCDLIKDKENICETTNIKSSDIENLVKICHSLIKMAGDANNKEEKRQVKKIISVDFYQQSNGRVREWLKSLEREERWIIGEDIKVVQSGWPLGMPLVCSLGNGKCVVHCQIL